MSDHSAMSDPAAAHVRAHVATIDTNAPADGPNQPCAPAAGAADQVDQTDQVGETGEAVPGSGPVAAVSPKRPREPETTQVEQAGPDDVLCPVVPFLADTFPAAAPDVHCRNASTLARANPFPADAHLLFEEEDHKYTVYGKPVDRSTTRVLGDFFDAFDAVKCTDEFYAGWASNPRSKYYEQIQRLRGEGYDDDEISARIRGDWTRLGEDASRLGTKLHLHCEYDCNQEPLPVGEDMSEIAKEIEQYECFKVSAFCRERGLVPYRTELTVAWRVGEGNVCAGQIDALYVDTAGHYYIVDFKRVVAKHALDPDELGFRGATGIGPARHLADTHYQKYSLQTSIYNIMLHQTHGIDAVQNMYLLRMHDDREEYELVKCADHREVARQVLALEHSRLVAAGFE